MNGKNDWAVEYATFFLSICPCWDMEPLTVRLNESIVAVHGLHEDHISAWLDTSSGRLLA